MFRIDKVITREKVSVVFDDGNIPAGLSKDTQRMLLPQCRPGHLFEDLNVDLLDILAHPLVEDGAEKIAESFSGYGAGLTLPSSSGLVQPSGRNST